MCATNCDGSKREDHTECKYHFKELLLDHIDTTPLPGIFQLPQFDMSVARENDALLALQSYEHLDRVNFR